MPIRCETESVTFHALDIVSDGIDDVRILVGEVTERRDLLTANCPPPGGGPPRGCDWEGPSTYTGHIFMGRLNADGEMELEPVAGATVPATRGSAAVGADGTMHLATYGPEDTEGGGFAGLAVHYLRIAAD